MQRIELTGNLGHDPELRFTPQGVAVCDFPVAHTDRRKNEQGEWEDVGDTQWFTVTLWRDKAERAAEALGKGDRVHVVGKVSVEAYTGKAHDGGEVPKARLRVQAYDVWKALPRDKPTPKTYSAPDRQPPADDPWDGATEPPW